MKLVGTTTELVGLAPCRWCGEAVYYVQGGCLDCCVIPNIVRPANRNTHREPLHSSESEYRNCRWAVRRVDRLVDIVCRETLRDEDRADRTQIH